MTGRDKNASSDEQGANNVSNGLDTGSLPYGQGVVFGEPMLAFPAVLLHSCCGPCSTAVIEQLAARFRITIYFCNSNIDDEAEYKKRLDTQREYVERYNTSPGMRGEPVALVCAPYKPMAFLKMVEGYDDCREGGDRCRICIEDRLDKTAAYAAMNGFENFSTTLTVSRHKNYRMISELGRALAMRYGVAFACDDFKKGRGEERAAELAKQYGLYRQDYCGCRFSKR